MRRLDLILQVKSIEDEAGLWGKGMQNVIELIESLEDLDLGLRQMAVRFYTAMMSVNPKNFADGAVSGSAFSKGHALMFKENITLKRDGNAVIIDMFPLVKNTTAKTKHYIYQCLYEAIDSHKAELNIRKYSVPAVVVIWNKRPGWDRISDADNVEINSVINAIAPHFFTDDGPKFLSVYRMGTEDGNASTSIYVLPLSEFPEWICKHQASLGSGDY